MIVDTGISTYETGNRRHEERSTSAHNTITCLNRDQSEVWASFRVGRRAKIIKLEESLQKITAQHDGYSKYGVIHERVFEFIDNGVNFNDSLISKEEILGYAHLHFHPEQIFDIKHNSVIADKMIISFDNLIDLELLAYNYSDGFNVLRPASKIKVCFQNNLKTRIKIL